MINTKLRKVMVSAVALAASITVVAPTAAFAADGGDTGGGTGGGSSGGSQRGAQWASIAYAKPGKAYDKFIDKAGYRKSHTDKQIKKRVGDINICKRSNVIWYIKSESNWTFNYDGATHGKRWNGSGTIENPKTKYNRGPTDAEVRAFKIWDKEENGKIVNKKPGYTIICSGAFAMPDKTRKTTSKKSDTKGKKPYTATEPYSFSTEIKPQSIGKNGSDPIGGKKNQLETQKSKTKMTNYGNLIKELKKTKGKGLKPADVKKKVKAALDKDKKLDHMQLDLSPNNKAGMAEGGILNVYENSMKATVTAREFVTTSTTTTCIYTQKWNMKKGKYDKETKKCSDKKEKTSKTSVSTNPPTQGPGGFWQMLAVHCNKVEFDALAKAIGEDRIVQQGDSAKGIAAMIHTKKYAQQPSKDKLDFGSESNPNKAKAATGKIGFFDKECPFDCTPSLDTKDGASDKNGATKNVESTGKVTKDGKYGATSEKHTNNFFEFFRDNEEKSVSVDVWYPKSNSNVKYSGAAPLSTTIVRDPNGTPGVSGTEGGKFTMKTKSGKELFKKDAETTNQKNWENGKEFSNSNATLLKGLHREFLVKATWASDTGKPQVINTKWEYKADVSSNILANEVGFGVKGAQEKGKTAKVSTPIEGKCYSNFGTQDQFDTTELFHKNTGTDSTNELDKNIIEKSEKPSEKKTNLVFNFVRSTTE